MPALTLADLENCDWFRELFRLVRSEFDKLRSELKDSRPSLETELGVLKGKIGGWTQSLGNPSLAPSVRSVIEGNLNNAMERIEEIESNLVQLEAQNQQMDDYIKPEIVFERIKQLMEVLAGNNPSRTNLELAAHIDKIECHPNGDVTVRLFKLGFLPECLPFLPRSKDERMIAVNADKVAGDPEIFQATPRKRGLRELGDCSGDRGKLMDAAHHATDVNRFAGFSPDLFHEIRFSPPPKKLHWFQEHAPAVAKMRNETGWSYEKLAMHFGKTPPTIRKAFLYAQDISHPPGSGPLSPE